MKVSEIFGVNSWLYNERIVKNVEQTLSCNDELPHISLNGRGSAATLSAHDQSALLLGAFKTWIVDHSYLLANLCPLQSATKYFQKKTSEELVEDFLAEVDINVSAMNTDLYRKLLLETDIFKKPFAVKLTGLNHDERRFIVNSLYGDAPDNKKYEEVFFEASLKACLLEEALHKRFVGAKRFSIEGLETFIGSICVLKHLAADRNIENIVLAMAHRGRLPALVIWGNLDIGSLQAGFNGSIDPDGLTGDVKYHWGYSSIEALNGRELKLDILPNPSHLESVNPLLFGYLRGRAQNNVKALGILAHGNAALCGQGVNQELLNFAGIKGFETPPVIHFVLDNLLGFTATPVEEKTSLFSSDIFSAFGVPIIFVNATNLDAVLKVVNIAFEYCQNFNKSCAIHLFGYRRYGHNEGDDPTVTQPLMYEEIKNLKSPVYYHSKKLNLKVKLDEALSLGHDAAGQKKQPRLAPPRSSPNEHILNSQLLSEIADFLEKQLQDVNLHPKVNELFQKRLDNLRKGGDIDWGLGEFIAFAAIMKGGKNIRLVGEDSKRGTFSHRHLAVWDTKTEADKVLLDGFAGRKCEALNSALSEYGVLGFEAGVSLGDPKVFCLWEAQFGDFVNGAQIIIDQYFSSSWEKWGISFPITLLLPHGQEGAGPEHSSARIERFLQLSANNNWTLIQPTTVENYITALLRQASSEKPCIIFTPKSLLRQKNTFFAGDGIEKASFHPYYYVKRGGESLVICSGKARFVVESKSKADILVLEQLFPIDLEQIRQITEGYRSTYIFQEEPRNQGIAMWLLTSLSEKPIHIISPASIAASAVGLETLFRSQQEEIIQQLSSIN
ncbi:MAG: thiamine pyrophosphate-dependent enzyme [Deltaproteobacteria bacterium]|nr:thiamine pyrophosphate-dependent enzyme [Deltaproteobacteria bacterium]